MLDDRSFETSLLRSISDVRAIAPGAVLQMVANVKSSPIDSGDYSETSVTTEHFTSIELGSLMEGFRKNGFFVTFHGDEIDFITDDLERASDINDVLKIVYNTAQSGIGIGRKSLVPAYCARRGLRICNSDAYVMSLARQKFHVHCILKRAGLPTADTWCYWPPNGWIGGPPPSDRRLIAKAAYESASIGLTPSCVGFAGPDFELMLRDKCRIYQQPFVVQDLIEGYEVEVPLIDLDRMRAVDIVSVQLNGSVELGDQVLYYDIIEAESYRYTPSAHFSETVKNELADIAERTVGVLGLRGIGRVDFRIDKSGRPHITDVAASPHLVEHSSFAHTFSWHGYDHADLLAAMIGANFRHWNLSYDSDQTTMSERRNPYL